MIEVKGKYNTAKVFTDLVDEASIAQVTELCNQEFIIGSKIRLMPDIHAGAGCTIGTTMTIHDKIVPNLVGVDIGCGMLVVKLKQKKIDLAKLDDVIRKYIPSGFNVRDTPNKAAMHVGIESLYCPFDLERAYKSLGTLGGGNHFIEVDKGADGTLYLVIHSGSRHLGVEVAKYYQELAYKTLTAQAKDQKELIARLTAEGRKKEIQTEIKKHKKQFTKDLAYLYGDNAKYYLHDMKIVQEYASANRREMAIAILDNTDLTNGDVIFQTIHNYIDFSDMVLRKGAVSARENEALIIPMNMRDGSLICVGKGNPDWNCSAPHGAGRIMSRAQAKARFTVEQFANEMKDVYTTSVGRGTIDECPMAYKPMQSILDNIGDTVTVKEIIKPIYNFKAGN